jgi:hypothetical protein
MTTRSTRRAAEMAIIDAAYRLIDRHGWQGHPFNDLSRAVYEHRQLGLDPTSQPIVGNNTTDTSAEAGASVLGSVGKLARQCFDEIATVRDGGGSGLTVDQLEQILNRSHQSVSARVNELRDKGWVMDSGRRRKTRSGRKAIVWTPTKMGWEQR